MGVKVLALSFDHVMV